MAGNNKLVGEAGAAEPAAARGESALASVPGSLGRWRWRVVGLLFAATSINYVVRASLAVLKPSLDQRLGWDQKDYGWVVTAFQAAYAIGYLVVGRWLDKMSVRMGLLLVVGLWSLAAMGHTLATSVAGFACAQAFLGLAEGGFFPAAIKAVAEWFPKQERALATGLFNSGSNAGAVLCPLLVLMITRIWNWQAVFVATGAAGLIWVGFWARLYDSPGRSARLSPAELAWIRQDASEVVLRIGWLELLRRRQTWVFMIGTMASAPIWWFYIFWAPDFLSKRYGLQLSQSSLPLMLIFLVAGLGGILGGWLSSALLRRGKTVNVARKLALLACALCAAPVFAAPFMPDFRWAAALVALAAAGHCGYAANLYTLVSDTVPRQAIGSVVGLGGMAGSIVGMLFAQLVSRVLHFTHNNFTLPFAFAASGYLLALCLIHLLLPRLEPMRALVSQDLAAKGI
jgi:ACS family hexuronate transporter-like MFS transporter